jgi:hypothetical protein
MLISFGHRGFETSRHREEKRFERKPAAWMRHKVVKDTLRNRYWTLNGRALRLTLSHTGKQPFHESE